MGTGLTVWSDICKIGLYYAKQGLKEAKSGNPGFNYSLFCTIDKNGHTYSARSLVDDIRL